MIRIGDMSSSDKKIVLLNVAYCLSAGRHDLMDVTVSYMDAATEKKQQTSVLTANFVKELQDAQVAAPVAVVVDKVRKNGHHTRGSSCGADQPSEVSRSFAGGGDTFQHRERICGTSTTADTI